MNIRTENWNGHEIRFVEKEPSEWWAVAKDIVEALGLKLVTRAISSLPKVGVTISKAIDNLVREQEVNVINEKNVYRLVIKSRKKEEEDFQDWVFEMLRTLRKQSELEGFQIFRMLDKEHQKEMMSKLNQSLEKPKRTHFIKANTIANKAISTKYGYDKMIKKKDMTPDMLIERQPILDDTVSLISAAEKFDLDISVSQKVYEKYLS